MSFFFCPLPNSMMRILSKRDSFLTKKRTRDLATSLLCTMGGSGGTSIAVRDKSERGNMSEGVDKSEGVTSQRGVTFPQGRVTSWLVMGGGLSKGFVKPELWSARITHVLGAFFLGNEVKIREAQHLKSWTNLPFAHSELGNELKIFLSWLFLRKTKTYGLPMKNEALWKFTHPRIRPFPAMWWASHEIYQGYIRANPSALFSHAIKALDVLGSECNV